MFVRCTPVLLGSPRKIGDGVNVCASPKVLGILLDICFCSHVRQRRRISRRSSQNAALAARDALPNGIYATSAALPLPRHACTGFYRRRKPPWTPHGVIAIDRHCIQSWADRSTNRFTYGMRMGQTQRAPGTVHTNLEMERSSYSNQDLRAIVSKDAFQVPEVLFQ